MQSEFIEILRQGYKENGYPREWKGRPADGYKIKWENGERKKVPYWRRRTHSKFMALLNRWRDY